MIESKIKINGDQVCCVCRETKTRGIRKWFEKGTGERFMYCIRIKQGIILLSYELREN